MTISGKHQAVETPRQMRALASPMRQEIVDALEASGPCSIRELASLIGRQADTLYFHIRVLRKAGLVVDVASSKPDSKGATIDVAFRPMSLRYDLASDRNRNEVTTIVAAMTRSASRRFRSAYKIGIATVEGRGRDLWAGSCQGWLSRNDLAEVNRLLTEILTVMRRRREPDTRKMKRYEITFVLAPLSKREAVT